MADNKIAENTTTDNKNLPVVKVKNKDFLQDYFITFSIKKVRVLKK